MTPPTDIAAIVSALPRRPGMVGSRVPPGAYRYAWRIAAEPLPEKRQELAAIFGKCAWYHSNQSGRTPEEREQRRATRTKTTQELDR